MRLWCDIHAQHAPGGFCVECAKADETALAEHAQRRERDDDAEREPDAESEES